MAVPDPRDAPPLRWGILAPGGIANKFARAIRVHTAATVVAVGSRDGGRAARFAAEHGIPRAYAGYDELVRDAEVDAVYVASPHSAHREHAVLAIEAGKHVLVEKALARNSAEVEAIFAAAQRSGVFAMEAMWTRFLPHVDFVHRTIASGTLGEVVSVVADHGQFFEVGPDHRVVNPALAGGAMLDLGVYPVSFIVDLLGAPTSVTAAGELTEAGVDGQVGMVFGYPARLQGVAHTTLWAKTPTTATISGTLARIEIAGDFYASTTLRVVRRDGTVLGEFDGGVDNGFQFEAAEAARCVSEGRQESERMSWASSRAVMAVMDEVRRQVGVRYPGE